MASSEPGFGSINPIQGAVALITGASSGIGEATAIELARLHARVAIVGRRGDMLGSVANRLRSNGSEAFVIEADLSQENAACEIVDRTVEHFGRLDILINNAGLMLVGPIHEAPVEEWHRMLDLNVLGLMRCTHAALPHLIAAASSSLRGVADVVNVSSVAGRVARANVGVYSATKYAVGAFSESLRQEMASRGVRVSVIQPGLVATGILDQSRPESQELIRARFESDEILEPADVADAIGYIVTRSRRTAINELLMRATVQAL